MLFSLRIVCVFAGALPGGVGVFAERKFLSKAREFLKSARARGAMEGDGNHEKVMEITWRRRASS